jgi:hypothetical protein
MNVDLAYELCGRLASVWVIVGAAETLSSLREYGTDGLFDPRIVKADVEATMSPVVQAATLGPQAVASVAAVRLTAGLVLLLAPTHPFVQAMAWTAVAASAAHARWRRPLGDDGADQMLLIMSTAFSMALLLRFADGALEVGVCFIAAQACLSYVVAGVAKLLGPDWRRGSVVAQVLATRAYGTTQVGRAIDRHPTLGRTLCWGTIVFEISFVGAIFLPFAVLIGLLAVAASFHLASAAFMGLNGFLWVFVATYPAIVYVNLQVATAL